MSSIRDDGPELAPDPLSPDSPRIQALLAECGLHPLAPWIWFGADAVPISAGAPLTVQIVTNLAGLSEPDGAPLGVFRQRIPDPSGSLSKAWQGHRWEAFGLLYRLNWPELMVTPQSPFPGGWYARTISFDGTVTLEAAIWCVEVFPGRTPAICAQMLWRPAQGRAQFGTRLLKDRCTVQDWKAAEGALAVLRAQARSMRRRPPDTGDFRAGEKQQWLAYIWPAAKEVVQSGDRLKFKRIARCLGRDRDYVSENCKRFGIKLPILEAEIQKELRRDGDL